MKEREGADRARRPRVYRIDRPLSNTAAESWRETERASFDEIYAHAAVPALDDDATFRPTITPPWEERGTPGGLVQGEAYHLLSSRGLAGSNLLDYGCGNGKWSMQLAARGARVSGFDLSPVAIDQARRRAARNGLDIRFDVADAASLPYANNAFDVALGVGVLHHVVKYAGTAAELRRVLRPGALAVFTEGLSENPGIEMARRFTMRGKQAAGDVGLTESMVHEWAIEGSFTTVELVPISMLLMAKRVIRLRPVLRALAYLDRRLFARWPTLRKYCGDCLVVLYA
jgi:2-polyprenyl-3-methyl-5-hydroxy-6-metoxy-1,4-benzoquinol methylase